MPYDIGRRIAIYGNSGSGKTTLGRALGERLGIPFIELDAIVHYRPNWEDRTDEDFRVQVQAALDASPEGWICDGNYGAVRDLILPQADTAIWLRLPFHVVYWRLASRTIWRSLLGAPLWNGNHESLRQTFFSKDSMLLWGITAWRRTRRRTAQALASIPHHANVIVLRTPREARELLATASRAR
ncbi:MAG: AAA family ATPase [Dehalococcoidia bacterium]|nr:MAG: AAA family ATPase [Dehalococcoidia bacterium]